MTSRLFYHKQTGAPVQIIARAQTKPTYQEVICYQELTKPYDHFVMEKRQFFAEYVKEFAELPLVGRKQIERRCLPSWMQNRVMRKFGFWKKCRMI